MGLMGEAAAWAVWKQQQHHQVSKQAMMAIKALINTNYSPKLMTFLAKTFGDPKMSWE